MDYIMLSYVQGIVLNYYLKVINNNYINQIWAT